MRNIERHDGTLIPKTSDIRSVNECHTLSKTRSVDKSISRLRYIKFCAVKGRLPLYPAGRIIKTIDVIEWQATHLPTGNKVKINANSCPNALMLRIGEQFVTIIDATHILGQNIQAVLFTGKNAVNIFPDVLLILRRHFVTVHKHLRTVAGINNPNTLFICTVTLDSRGI